MLDEKGFVFIDDNNRPFWVAMRFNRPTLLYWHADKKWVTLREVTTIEIWEMNDQAIPEHLAEKYHEQHKKQLI